MKRVWKVFGFLAILGLVLSCTVNIGEDDPETTDDTGSGVDWTNYQTAGSYSIRVKNESNVDLVAFKSSLSEANKLGGVRKNEVNHGFKLNDALFNQNTDFSIIVITLEQYRVNKGNLAALEQKPFTRLFAVYNKNGTNEVPFIVSGTLGGTNKFIIQNLTGYDVEFRLESPRGTTLGYAPHQTNNTILYMNNGSYIIYPVFKKYNSVRDEILTIYPRDMDGFPVEDGFSFPGGGEYVMNAQNYSGNTSLSSGAAFLVVQNDSDNGVSVYHGSVRMTTETGEYIINAGKSRTFTILMDKLGNNVYESTFDLAGWSIKFLESKEKSIQATTLDVDYRYTVKVTGNWNWGTQAITAPQKGTKPVTDFSNSN